MTGSIELLVIGVGAGQFNQDTHDAFDDESVTETVADINSD